jgi:hypothetical protein
LSVHRVNARRHGQVEGGGEHGVHDDEQEDHVPHQPLRALLGKGRPGDEEEPDGDARRSALNERGRFKGLDSLRLRECVLFENSQEKTMFDGRLKEI